MLSTRIFEWLVIVAFEMQGKDKIESKGTFLGRGFNVLPDVNQSLHKDMVFFSFNKESNNIF